MAQTMTLRAHGLPAAQRRALEVAGFVAGFQVLHFAGVAGGDPGGKVLELREIVHRGDAGEFESGCVGCLFHEFGE